MGNLNPSAPLPAHIECESQQHQKTAQVVESYLESWPLIVVTCSLCLGTFLVALDVNIIGVAVPKISAAFQSLDDIAWYGSAYLLAITAFQPVTGFIYKYFNVRVTYLSSIVIFEAGSIMCAAAPNSDVFILGRAIAGLGAAGILQGALAIIGYIVPLERRPLFMGIVISVFGVSVCTGPVMGGAFTDRVNWRWCFWINVPIGAVVLFLLAIFLRLKGSNNEFRAIPFTSKLKRLDILGTVLFLGAVCCLILALQWGGQTKPWRSPQIIGLFVGCGLLAIIFGFVQWKRGDDAIVPLRILRQRSILVGSIFLFFFGMLNYVYSFFLPFYFQAVQGDPATKSGVRLIPLVLPQVSILIIIGAIVTRWGYYVRINYFIDCKLYHDLILLRVPYMILGQIICIIGSGLLIQIGVGTKTVEWASYLVITGTGMGMSMQLPYTAVQIALSEGDVPVGNAISVFSNQLGGAIAIPICEALLVNTLRGHSDEYRAAVSPEIVIHAGPYDLQSLVHGDILVFEALREVYAVALRRIFIVALSAGCAAAVCTFGMEWKNVKQVQKAKSEGVGSMTMSQEFGGRIHDNEVKEAS